MEFTNPYIFYFLLSLLIPIIIHLFNFRKRRVIHFSNISLLKRIETEYKSKKNIRRVIILLTRLMCLSLIITAFTIPYIKNKSYKGDVSKIGIYIDNSFSMNMGGDGEKTMINQAKNNAINIISTLNDNQSIMIMTNNFNEKNQKWHSKSDALKLIDSIKISGYTKPINDIINRYYQITDTTDFSSLYLFSDFQQTDTEKIYYSNSNTNIKIAHLIANNNGNISIDSCYLHSPLHRYGEIEKVSINLTNHSNENILTTIKLTINGQQKSYYQIEIDKNTTITEDLNYINDFKNNTINGIVEIEENDLEFDNQLYFSYNIIDKIEVLNINDKQANYYIQSVFSDSLFNITTYNTRQIKYNIIHQYDLIILDHIENIDNGLTKTLEKYISNGGHVLIFPNKNANIKSYNTLFELTNIDFIKKWESTDQYINHINYNHAIFNGVFKTDDANIDLPKINAYFSTTRNQNIKRLDALSFNTKPFLAEYNYKKGSAFVCFTDLNIDQNFPLHALFLPCLYNVAIMKSKETPIYHIIKSGLLIEQNNIQNQISVNVKNDNGFDLIASIIRQGQMTLIDLKNNLNKSGHYNLHIDQNIENIISLNYNRTESNMTFLNKKEISNFFINNNYTFIPLDNNNIPKNFEENNHTKTLYHIIIITALLMIIIEIILLKIWKI